MPFIVILNRLDRLELIVDALRQHPSRVAHQLADGIAEYTLWQGEDGTIIPVPELLQMPTEERTTLRLT